MIIDLGTIKILIKKRKKMMKMQKKMKKNKNY